MFKSKKILTSSVLSLILMTGVNAAEVALSDISLKFQELTKFKVFSVKQSEVQGLLILETEKGVFYSSENGEYLFSGSLHEFTSGLNNLTRSHEALISKKKIDELKNEFITFKSPTEKAEILVFYDTSCGYCRKLHDEVSQYNAAGITVHYAMFPRNGVSDTRTIQAMKNIVCSNTPNLALNAFNRGAQIEEITCDNAHVIEMYGLGSFMKVTGTPAIFDMNGFEVSKGYVPAKTLAEKLNLN